MAATVEGMLVEESLKHLQTGLEGFGNVADIWRHEGLKKGVEHTLHYLSKTKVGGWLISQLGDTHLDCSNLETDIGGVSLDGPVGIAAGWDKTGKTILGWQLLGAKHITIGGVPYYPQRGNPMPRLRTFDHYIGDRGTRVSLNSYGFASPGVDEVVKNISKQKETGAVDIPVFVQVTLNKEFYEPDSIHMIPEMIAKTVKKVVSVADEVNLGLSSPNTLGMRDTQAYEFLVQCVEAAQGVMPDNLGLRLKGDGDSDERIDIYGALSSLARKIAALSSSFSSLAFSVLATSAIFLFV